MKDFPFNKVKERIRCWVSNNKGAGRSQFSKTLACQKSVPAGVQQEPGDSHRVLSEEVKKKTNSLGHYIGNLNWLLGQSLSPQKDF